MKKKGMTAAILLIAAVLAMGCVGETTEPIAPEKLSAPVIALSDNVVTWSAVEHADSYAVTVGDHAAQTVTATSYTVDVEDAGSYTIYVIAKSADTQAYVDSDRSNTVTYVVEEKPPKSEKAADAAAWKAAFDFSSVSNGTVLETLKMQGGEETYEETYQAFVDGNTSKETTTVDGETVTRYMRYDAAENRGYYYEYDQAAEKWFYDTIPDGIKDMAAHVNGFDAFIEEFIETDVYISDRFDAFTYDEDRGVYVCNLDHDPQAAEYDKIEFTVFIRNGKIGKGTIYVKQTEADTVYENFIAFEFYDIGSTAPITVPPAEPKPV